MNKYYYLVEKITEADKLEEQKNTIKEVIGNIYESKELLEERK